MVARNNRQYEHMTSTLPLRTDIAAASGSLAPARMSESETVLFVAIVAIMVALAVMVAG